MSNIGKNLDVFCTGLKLNKLHEHLGSRDLAWHRLPWRVSEEKVLTPDQYDAFVADFMQEQPWLSGKGGTESRYEPASGPVADDAGVAKLLQDPVERQKWMELASVCGVLVICPGRPCLMVDPQGYNYARYVGLLPGQDYFGFVGTDVAVRGASRLFAAAVQKNGPRGLRLHVGTDRYGLCSSKLEAEALQWALVRNGDRNPDAAAHALVQARRAMRGPGKTDFTLAETLLPDGTRIVFTYGCSRGAQKGQFQERRHFQLEGMAPRMEPVEAPGEVRGLVVCVSP